MRYPTRTVLESELAAVKLADPRSTLATLVVAIARDRAGSTIADGYPRATPGHGEPGGGTFDVRRSSSVEAAALGRATGERQRDRVHENLTQAFGYLDAAITAISALEARVANLVELMGIPTPPRCDVLVSLTADHEATNVGGRLTRPHNLSGPAWDFVRRHDRLPSTDEVHSYERFGAWKIRNVRAALTTLEGKP